MAEPVEVPDDYVEPQITVWPECKQCGIAYVYRRSYRMMGGGWVWVWQPDWLRDSCRRESESVLVKEDTDG
jgi:hypothetical protein